jgi:hypothetical protein
VVIYGQGGSEETLPLMSKIDVARAVLDAATRLLPPTQT